MRVWGAIFGGAAGFAVGGPLGAALGAAAGYGTERFARRAGLLAPAEGGAPDLDAAAANEAFTVAVIVLGAKLAKADGRVTRNEIAAFKRVFRIPPGEEKNVGRVFNEARRDPSGFEPYAEQIAELFRGRPAMLQELLMCLCEIARADGEIGRAEAAFLDRVAQIFELDGEAVRRMRAEKESDEIVDPWQVLGVPRGSGPEAIKAAHRRLVREHHPDRLAAQGLPQEFIDGATRRLARINVAYDQLRARRGAA